MTKTLGDQEPHEEKNNQDSNTSDAEVTFSQESARPVTAKEHRDPAEGFFKRLKPRTSQDVCNYLLVVFNCILAIVAWNQYTSDAAYLTLAPILFDKDSGFVEWPIENDGRRPARQITANVQYAYFDPAEKVLRNTIYRFANTLPDIPANKTPYMLSFDFPAWDSSRLISIKRGVNIARIRVVLTYSSYGIRQSQARVCEETVPIKKGTEMTWGPCDLSIFDRVLKDAKKDYNYQKTTIGSTGPAP